MPAFEPHVVDDPIPPGPAPIPPGPGRPQPDPPVPSPEPPWPDPLPEPEPRPDDDGLAARSTEPAFASGVNSNVQSDVVVELRGSVAVLFGVVERAADRERIVDEIASLESISRVESNLRPPAA